MNVLFSKVETTLFQVVKQGLVSDTYNSNINTDLNEDEWSSLLEVANKQGVLALLFPVLCENRFISQKSKKVLENYAKMTVLQQYRLLFLGKYLVQLLEQHHISVVLMKGVSIGAYYPVPELRKSGDIDLLLLSANDLEKASKLLCKEGFQKEKESHSLHHVGFHSAEGIEIELHTMLAEPFDNKEINSYLMNLLGEVQTKSADIMGIEVPVLSNAYFAFELLLHMLQHFLRAGFGLKLLCDWVVFWQTEWSNQEKSLYLNLIKNAKIQGFSEMITQVCIEYLGLSKELVSWMDIQGGYPVEEFLREVLDSEEFGKSNKNRMVVMRGTSLLDYVREFHHQMNLNFPKASRYFVLWPSLWLITLLRFLRNNRKLRKTSTRNILMEAKKRSGLTKKIKLFEEIV